MEKYSIRLESFEGPMDLLMHLIEKNKIDIYDIPISSLTEQYLEYLERFKEYNMDIASEFLVMAATLLQIKSRMMLPKAVTEDEEGDAEDPRQELINRILEYRRFKDVSEVLTSQEQEQGKYFTRRPGEIPLQHLPPEHASLELLTKAFRLLMEVRPEPKIPQGIVAPEEYSVKDKMKEIRSILQANRQGVDFFAFFSDKPRNEIIAVFLAMLELVRRRAITLQQGGLYSDITILAGSKLDETEDEDEAITVGN